MMGEREGEGGGSGYVGLRARPSLFFFLPLSLVSVLENRKFRNSSGLDSLVWLPGWLVGWKREVLNAEIKKKTKKTSPPAKNGHNEPVMENPLKHGQKILTLLWGIFWKFSRTAFCENSRGTRLDENYTCKFQLHFVHFWNIAFILPCDELASCAGGNLPLP